MRKHIHLRYLLFAFSAVVMWGCSKPYSEAIPTVQFVSVVPYGLEDSVLLTGNVTSVGASPVQYVGFSYSSVPSFSLLSNQVLLKGTNGKFKVILPANDDSTYYFECFAANQYGYNTSSVYKYTVPATKPDSSPCNIPSNTVILDGLNYATSDIFARGNVIYGSYCVEADFWGSYALDIYFNMVPTNGQYNVLNTVDFMNSVSRYAATITLNGNSFNEAGYVYIAQNKDGSTTLSFCSLVVNYLSTNITVSAKLTFN